MDRAIFITARTSSSRLPGKCLLEVCPGITAIEFLINRLSNKGYLLFLCTSTSPADDTLAGLVKNTAKATVFRGSEDDKLKRWIDCAEMYNIEFFVTADGDDLLVDPELINMAFEQYRNHWHGFINCPNTPSGSFSWGIETKSLKRIYSKHATANANTEMGWAWFDDVHELENIPSELIRKDVRMTLDYEDDLEFFRKTIGSIGDASLRDILKFLDSNRHIADININREDDWKSNQKKLVSKLGE